VEDVEPHDGAPYFTWYGLKHDSVSDRSRRYRLGGRFHDVSQGLHTRLYPIDSSGLGMPPIRLNVQHFESSERSLVQASRAFPRSVMLTFWARKHPDTQVCFPASLKELHQAREALEEIVKPDRSPGAQPFLMRYLDGLGVPMDLETYYESGLEWSGDLRYPWKNSFGVRFYCPTPYWLEDTQDQIVLDPSVEEADCDYVCARLGGSWTDLAGGVDGTVKAILAHPNGQVFIGGAFTQRILIWNGVGLVSLDEDIDNGEVRAIAVAPNGDIYVGGTFTTIGAPGANTTYNYIARYDVVAETWHQLDVGADPNSGLDGAVNDIAVAADGTVYIAGEFTETGTGADLNYVCSYDPGGDAFAGLGASPGLNAVGHAVEVDIDGSTVYFGGAFTDEAGAPAVFNLERIAKWTGAWGEMSDEGMDDIVRVLRKSIDGRVYAGGDFTVAGFANAEKIAMWNRKTWYPLGYDAEGVFGGDVYDIAVTDKGLVFAVGDFTSATGTALARRLVSWNFTRFGHWDIVLPGTPIVHAIEFNPGNEGIFLGFSAAGAATVASTQAFDNNGNAKAWPVLDVLGPARLEFLELDWVSAIVRMDLTVGANEHVLIDFRLGKMKAVSEVRGNVIDGIMADSDLGGVYLLPGRNRIHFLAEDATEDTEIVLRWQLADWSFDAT